MRQTVGFSVVLAVAVAAMRISVPLSSTTPPQMSGGKPGTLKLARGRPGGTAANYRGGCSAYDLETAATQFPRDADRSAGKTVIDRFFGLDSDEDTSAKLHSLHNVHYTIALVADPRHTNLSLMFDRQAALIQQAAQDEGYTYNSSWFPWSAESQAYPLLENQQYAEQLTDHREACPGVLLFRRSLQSSQPAPAKPADPYSEAMVVLVVGEQPTGGLNEDQWSNAVLWLQKNASPVEGNQERSDTTEKPRILRILGPTFSGSLVSLDRDLKKLYSDPGSVAFHAGETASEVFPGPNTPTRLLSGVISGCSSIRWFQQRLIDNHFRSKVVFGSFSENDELGIYRFLSYMSGQGADIQDTAILSEDETAYALPNGDTTVEAPSDACEYSYDPEKRPVRLFYPRDISALRNAYEKQSVFASPNQAERAIHPILQDAGAVEGGEASNSTDTIPVYSGKLTAIAEESLLYGIVSNLRIHHTRYLMLRCTNPLDYLFLTRFFHRAYPEGRIVTVGADLLFRREIDTTEFRGVLALTTYPLLPRNQHWSWLSQSDKAPFSHAHRVFESSLEGSYVAARYLFGTQEYTRPAAISQPNQSITLPLKEDIPDYADPYWLDVSSNPDTEKRITGPPTWIAVVGRDGYWPIAVLNHDFDVRSRTKTPVSTTVKLVNSRAHYDRASNAKMKLNSKVMFRLPLPWSICAVAALLLLTYQAFGVRKGSDLSSVGFFSLFRRVSTPSQAVLLGINGAFAAAIMAQLVAIVVGFPRTYIFIGNAYGALLYGIAGAILLGVMLYSIAAPFRKRVAITSFFITFGTLASICYRALWKNQESANSIVLFYRMAHLTNGVSPLMPVLLLFVGLYVWTWQAMAGNSLLCSGRPLLPKLIGVAAITGLKGSYLRWLGVSTEATGRGPGHLKQAEYRISSEMERRIVQVASPMSMELRVLLLPTILLVAACGYIGAFGPPLLSLESHAYAVWLNLALLAVFLLITTEAGRLYFSWAELRRMLSALNHLRLRRTFSKLTAVTQGSLWSVSGSVQRIQYHFFEQQLDAAHRLNQLSQGRSSSLSSAVKCGHRFARMSAKTLNTGPQWDMKIFSTSGDVSVREQFNNAVAGVLNELLEEWKEEEESLNFPERHPAGAESGETTFEMKLSDNPIIAAAEEFVCLHYIAFIQNILGRMRTMTLSMVSLFVTVCLAISFYPFVPRTQIGMWMIVNLGLIAAVVVYVYAGMERDETLSHITNTTPGRLGNEFYLKTAGFLAGPVIGLLTTQFPSISESVLSWLQPGLDALK